jgi:hypothetical protein
MVKLKTFEYRVFDISGAFKFTISPKWIKSLPKFTSNINGGQGNLNLTLNQDFKYQGISRGDTIQVYKTDAITPNGFLIYTGFVDEIDRSFLEATESITYRIYGVYYLMNKIYARGSGNAVYSVNEDPKTTIENSIDTMNTHYNLFKKNISNFWSNISTDYDYIKIANQISDLREQTNFFFYIDQTWEVTFAPKPWTSTHILTVGREVIKITSEEDGKDIVNSYDLEYKSGTVSSSDATSETQNGLRELKETQTSIGNTSSAQISADNYILENKNEKRRIKLDVNSLYDIDSIKPGDTVKVLGLDYEIDNLQIHKIAYNIDRVGLELEQIKTFSTEILTQ